jgi:hypothetical protein
MAGGKTRLAKDFRDLLRVFGAHEVRLLVVGAYALAVLGRPRATGDLDVWVDPTPENAERAFAALRDFGAPLYELRVGDLARPGIVFQIGLPPLRIDVLTAIDGVVFFFPPFPRLARVRSSVTPAAASTSNASGRRVASTQRFKSTSRVARGSPHELYATAPPSA